MKKKTKEPEGGQFSVNELIRGFMEYSTDHGKQKWFPSMREPIWHELVYATRRKTEALGMKVAFGCMGEFDYEGPFPKVSGWSGILFAIRGICDQRTSDWKIMLLEELPHKEMTALLQEVVKMMFTIASEINFFKE